ncbi:MAG: helix-turn-helix domain-containing protein, partial [Promethearchaeota archaeon]
MAQKEKNSQSSTPPRKGQRTSKPKVRINVDEELMKTLETRFSLSASEARAYIAILAMGQLTPHGISIYSDISMTEIEPALESLLSRNLIKVMPGIVSRYRAFAPYKDLADVVSEFDKYTTTSLDKLQTIQKEVKDEISSKFKATSSRIETKIGIWSEQQSTTINDVIAKTKEMLDKIATNLPKAVTSVSETSCNGISSQSKILQQNLEQTITDGVKQIQISLTESLEKAHKTIEAYQGASEEWLGATTNRILKQIETITNQLKTLIEDEESTIEQTSETLIDSTTTELTNQIEKTHLLTQKTTAAITKGLETFGETQQKAITEMQKQHALTVAKIVQQVNQRFRQSWVQRIQGIEKVIAEIDKTLRKDTHRLSQVFAQSAAEMHTTLEKTSQTASQIVDQTRQNLGNKISESQKVYQKLQRETEAAIAKWPPTALKFTQLTRMKGNLVNLTEQTSNQLEKLLRSMNNTLNIEMKGAQQKHLEDIWTLFEQLSRDLTSQQSTLTTNVETITNELGKTLTTRFASRQRANNRLLRKVQRNVQAQEKETKILKDKVQTLFRQQGASLIDAFGAASSRIEQFIKERGEQAREAVEELGNA